MNLCVGGLESQNLIRLQEKCPPPRSTQSNLNLSRTLPVPYTFIMCSAAVHWALAIKSNNWRIVNE
jgi:hypothetical protein